MVGGQGLTPNAWALAQYIGHLSRVQSIGGIRPCDAIGDHCRGVALDIMIGGNMALGDAIYADMMSHQAAHAINTACGAPDHFSHVHCTVL